MAVINTLTVGSTDYTIKDNTMHGVTRWSYQHYTNPTDTSPSSATGDMQTVLPWSVGSNLRPIRGLYPSIDHSSDTRYVIGRQHKGTDSGSQLSYNKYFYGIQGVNAGRYLINYSLTARTTKTNGEELTLINGTASGTEGISLVGETDASIFRMLVYNTTNAAYYRTYSRTGFITLSAGNIVTVGTTFVPSSNCLGALYLYYTYHSMSMLYLG